MSSLPFFYTHNEPLKTTNSPPRYPITKPSASQDGSPECLDIPHFAPKRTQTSPDLTLSPNRTFYTLLTTLCENGVYSILKHYSIMEVKNNGGV